MVEADNYLAQLSRYIHLNPAAAGISPRADQYRWSSYGAYLGKRRAPVWLHRDVTLALFGARRARERYHAFVEQGVDEEFKAFYGKKNLSSILGGAPFLRTLRRKQQAKVLPKPARRATLPSLQRIAQVDAALFGVATDTLFVPPRGGAIRSKRLPRPSARGMSPRSRPRLRGCAHVPRKSLSSASRSTPWSASCLRINCQRSCFDPFGPKFLGLSDNGFLSLAKVTHDENGNHERRRV